MRIKDALAESPVLRALAALLVAAAGGVPVFLPPVFALSQTQQAEVSAASAPMRGLEGWRVRDIQFRGVETTDEDELRSILPLKVGDSLERDKVRESIRTLYATGRFADIQVEAERNQTHDVNLVFVARPNFFVSQVDAEGAPARPNASQIVNASKLQLGELFTPEKLQRARQRIQTLLEENGYYRLRLGDEEQTRPETQEINILFHLAVGQQAQIGGVMVRGKANFSGDEIREIARLHVGDPVSADRLNNGLQRLRKRYQKQNRLLAQVTADQIYRAEKNMVDYTLTVEPGPVVEIRVEGFHLRRGLIKKYIPVYQENALDEDLLNEGRRNLLDYLQTTGYFEAQVGIKKEPAPAHDVLRVVYVIDAGTRHKLVKVLIRGNRYFDVDLLRSRMQVQAAGRLFSHGRYSQLTLAGDVRGLEQLYRSQGFSEVKVSGNAIDNYAGIKDQVAVEINIDEGRQNIVGALHLVGNKTLSEERLLPLLTTVPGQPFSDFDVAGDRDTVLNEYFNTGFPNATFQASATPLPGEPHRMDVTYQIHEGDQIFVDRVLVRGLNYTRPRIVQREIQIHPGDPVSQVAMLDTQRRLYDLGIFNQVDTAIQNPEGQEPDKNILLDLREAKRYTFDYGGGLEVQTGTPAGVTAPKGNTGISPRVTFNVTRLNFRGVNHTITMKSHLGRLQQRALLSYDAPHLANIDSLRLTFTTFYDKTLDVSTFTSKRLEGSVQAQQVVRKGSTLFYRFAYRRVQATNFAANFNQNEVPLLSQPTRVGMPGLTYIRDHRDNPVESTRGSYDTLDTGVSSGYFGSEADFSRFLAQNSTYYRIKKKYVFARSTRIGVETPFRNTLVQSPQQASFGIPSGFTVIPLPERFFSGGGNSLRAFGLNQAGPRDLNSGFPLGGSGLFINNLELRMPPVTLPLVQDNVGFALFHDAGNVFDTGHDMLHSLARWRQPNPGACKNQSTYRQCDFNYIAHAVGVGIRYKTPIGPVRFDIGYNLNPPVFPSFQSVTNPTTGKSSSSFTPQRLGHVNVFFSIGQTF
ncbi:MAG: BamA/TamA family outer membrane protein [Acidobacteria bacterium]|nr:BamA/TamA family outer membrane protein [Acidobacteriota bacterium]